MHGVSSASVQLQFGTLYVVANCRPCSSPPLLRSASFRTYYDLYVNTQKKMRICYGVCVCVCTLCTRLIRCEAVNHHLTTNLPAHFLKFSRPPFVNNTFTALLSFRLWFWLSVFHCVQSVQHFQEHRAIPLQNRWCWWLREFHRTGSNGIADVRVRVERVEEEMERRCGFEFKRKREKWEGRS